MGTTAQRETGTALAELRARTALRGAGLDPSVPIERVSSVTNEVWLTPEHAVRVNRRPSNRLYREALVAGALPAEVGYPRVVAHGGGKGEDWLVTERVKGEPLAHVWPGLTDAERYRAVDHLAVRLAALHRTPAPPDLPPIENAPQLLEVGAANPTVPVVAALRRAMQLDHVDTVMLADAVELVTDLASTLVPFEANTLVHGDVTFENVLWHEGRITALLDVEWARPGPRDLDLDILLRCAAYPQLHVGDEYVERHPYRRLRRGPVVVGAGVPLPLRVPAADRPRAGVLHRLRRARPPGVTAPGRIRVTFPPSTPTTG